MWNTDTENRDTEGWLQSYTQIFLLPGGSVLLTPELFKGPLCNTSEITIKILAIEKEQEHINKNSCAYAGIGSDCFYNLENDFFFSSKDLIETLRLKSCEQLNQSVAGYVMNKAGWKVPNI